VVDMEKTHQVIDLTGLFWLRGLTGASVIN
jgi:hypothetical protein